jgi:hypothetical protein
MLPAYPAAAATSAPRQCTCSRRWTMPPAHPPPPAATPALASGPRRRPYPQPWARPCRGPPPAGHHHRRPGLPPRHPALRITRRVRPLHGRRWRTVVVYAITSLTAAQARPARLADSHPQPLGHRGAAPHPRRHLAEDASQVRARTAPRAMGSLRATSPSPPCVPMATATSPPPCVTTPATPPASYPSSASPARESCKPAPCRDPGMVCGSTTRLLANRSGNSLSRLITRAFPAARSRGMELVSDCMRDSCATRREGQGRRPPEPHVPVGWWMLEAG